MKKGDWVAPKTELTNVHVVIGFDGENAIIQKVDGNKKKVLKSSLVIKKNNK